MFKKNSPPPRTARAYGRLLSLELHRYPEGIQYLAEHGVHDARIIEELGIGYARGGNLRPHLQASATPWNGCLKRLDWSAGPDTFCRA